MSGNMKLPKNVYIADISLNVIQMLTMDLGLRKVFKYSRGYTYLTQTPRPPKEIIEVTNEWQKSKRSVRKHATQLLLKWIRSMTPDGEDATKITKKKFT